MYSPISIKIELMPAIFPMLSQPKAAKVIKIARNEIRGYALGLFSKNRILGNLYFSIFFTVDSMNLRNSDNFLKSNDFKNPCFIYRHLANELNKSGVSILCGFRVHR